MSFKTKPLLSLSINSTGKLNSFNSMQPFYYSNNVASPCSDMQYTTFIQYTYPYDFKCPCQTYDIRESEILEQFPDSVDDMRGTPQVLTINQELHIEKELSIVKELVGIKQEDTSNEQEIQIEVKQGDKDRQKTDEQVENTEQEIYIDKDEFQEYKVYQDYKTGFRGLDEIEVVRI